MCFPQRDADKSNVTRCCIQQPGASHTDKTCTMNTLTQEKLKCFHREFPWLDQYIPPNEISEIKVSRVNELLLHWTRICLNERFWVWTDNMYLLDGEGQLIAEVGKPLPGETLQARWWHKIVGYEPYFAETASNCLVRLGSKDQDVCFILYLSARPALFKTRRVVTIYKSPKGFTFKDWKKQLIQRQQNREKQLENEARRLVNQEMQEAETGEV